MWEAVRRVVILQLFITTGACAVTALGAGMVAAWSALVGGALGFVPTLVYWFTTRLLRSNKPDKVVAIHLFAEFVKIAATLVLFVLALVYLKAIQFAPMLGTFILTLGAYWIALYSLSRADDRQRD